MIAPTVLAERYRFEAVTRRSQRLPPRGLLRVVHAHVTAPDGSAFNHTLFFTSLLAWPLYQEAIVTHWTMPAPGRHGPFNTDELSPADYVEIEAAGLLDQVATHLDYDRLGATPIDAATRSRVLESLGWIADRGMRSFRLSAGDWFNAVENRYHPHEWSHALLEFHEYLVVDPPRAWILMFAFD